MHLVDYTPSVIDAKATCAVAGEPGGWRRMRGGAVLVSPEASSRMWQAICSLIVCLCAYLTRVIEEGEGEAIC